MRANRVFSLKSLNAPKHNTRIQWEITIVIPYSLHVGVAKNKIKPFCHLKNKNFVA